MAAEIRPAKAAFTLSSSDVGIVSQNHKRLAPFVGESVALRDNETGIAQFDFQ